MKAYIAGPLFDEGERWWIEKVERVVVESGFATFLPHRDNPPKDQHNVAAIFANDRRGIDECDLVVASLNGLTTDDGTAWELGMPSPSASRSSVSTPTGAGGSITRWST
jgi:nucleoside 2-deoxyribosyltransferase